ncbi:hypothetical protein DPSP01_008492 [Paraphaeosphaeria sporulosa]
MDAVVDTSAAEDTIDEAIDALAKDRVTLPMLSAAAVLSSPVVLPAVSMAEYVGNANPPPCGYCFGSEPEQQSWFGQWLVIVHSAVVSSPAGDSAHE